jgi:hypothetical protein
MGILSASCKNTSQTYSLKISADSSFVSTIDCLDACAILRYQAPFFEKFALTQKLLLHYLVPESLSGRLIAYDHNYSFNLFIRHFVDN